MLTEISRKKYGLIYIIHDCVKINLAGVGGEWGMRARSNLTRATGVKRRTTTTIIGF